MFKKILTFCGAFAVSLGFLAGCNLVKINTPVYYNQVVAEVKYKDTSREFTMKDLINAYNTNRSTLEQNNLTGKDAVERVANIMVERHIFIERLKEIITLSQSDLNAIRQETYDSINETLKEIESEVRTEWDRVVEETETEEQERMRDAFEPYEQPFEEVYENGSLVLKRVDKDESEEVEPVGDFEQVITDTDISAEAMKRYNTRMQVNAKNEGRKNVSNQTLFNEEIERVYNILLENEYITRFQTQLELEYEIDYSAVENLYKQHLRAQIDDFSNDIALYHSKVREDASKVFYHPVSNQYANVTHILVKLSEEQNEQIAELKKELDANEITQNIYDQRLEDIKLATMVTYDELDEEENIVQKTGHLNAIYNHIVSEVNAAGSLLSDKAEKFNEFVHVYNDDPGIMNKEFPYTVNLTNDGGQDVMIAPFTEAVKGLQEQGAGAVSQLVFAEFAEGEFGFHIIMNLGVVEANQIVSPDGVNWIALWNTRPHPVSNKRLFNVIYDQLAKVNSDGRMNDIVSTAKANSVITLYQSKMESLWK